MNGETYVIFHRWITKYKKEFDQSFQHLKGLCMDTKEQSKLEETITLAVYCHQTHVTKVIDNTENCCKYLQAKFALNFAVIAFNHISDCKVQFLSFLLGSKSFKKSCSCVDFLHTPPLFSTRLLNHLYHLSST